MEAESRRYEGRPEDGDFRSSDSPRAHGTSAVPLLRLLRLSLPSVDIHTLSSSGYSISSPISVCPTTLATWTSTIWSSRQRCISTTYGSTRGLRPARFPNCRLYFPVRLAKPLCFVICTQVSRRYRCRYEEAYTNPNLTTWVDDYGQSVPKSSYLDQC